MASSSSTSIEKSGEQTPPQLVQDGPKLEANTPGNDTQEAEPNASPRQIHGILVRLVQCCWILWLTSMQVVSSRHRHSFKHLPLLAGQHHRCGYHARGYPFSSYNPAPVVLRNRPGCGEQIWRYRQVAMAVCRVSSVRFISQVMPSQWI